MGRYLVERYLSVAKSNGLAEEEARLRATATDEVRLLLTYYSPEDETCFHLFDASAFSLVRDAGRSAGLVLDRIVPVVEVHP